MKETNLLLWGIFILVGTLSIYIGWAARTIVKLLASITARLGGEVPIEALMDYTEYNGTE